jgi:hypothetical protein
MVGLAPGVGVVAQRNWWYLSAVAATALSRSWSVIGCSLSFALLEEALLGYLLLGGCLFGMANAMSTLDRRRARKCPRGSLMRVASAVGCAEPHTMPHTTRVPAMRAPVTL